MFVSVPRYLLALKEKIFLGSEYADFINQHILEADIVVWDDIAPCQKQALNSSLIICLILINTRIDSGKSNIFTSNLGKERACMLWAKDSQVEFVISSMEIELRGSDKRYLRVCLMGGESVTTQFQLLNKILKNGLFWGSYSKIT